MMRTTRDRQEFGAEPGGQNAAPKKKEDPRQNGQPPGPQSEPQDRRINRADDAHHARSEGIRCRAGRQKRRPQEERGSPPERSAAWPAKRTARPAYKPRG